MVSLSVYCWELLCFGLVRIILLASKRDVYMHTHTHFRLLVISSVSHDSCQVSQVCCSFYSGQSMQFRKVCSCSATPFIPRVPYNVMVTVHFSFSFLWGPWEHVKHLQSPTIHSLSYLGTAAATLYCALSVCILIT